MRVSGENWLQAQYSVLGAALIEPKLVSRVLTGTAEADYSTGCAAVYLTMRRLFEKGEPVDVVTVGHALGSSYRSFLAELMDVVPSGANVEHYIKLCREQSRIMRLRAIAPELGSVEALPEARELIEQATALLADSNRSDCVDMSAAMRSFMERKQKKAVYLGWPIAAFNDLLYAQLGDFIILGAEPSVGKTAFALQCAWHWAKQYKVGFFSLETSPEKLFDRLMASVGGLNMGVIKGGELTELEWDRVVASSQEVVSRNLDLIPASGFTTADMRARILEKGYQIVIVDYVQLISGRGSNRYEQVTGASIDLHNIAQGMGVVVMGLSQLSRSDDDRTPKNSDLRESGQLEQDADLIMMLHLEKKANPSGNRKLTVTKHKEGECFQTLLSFDGLHQTFAKAQRTGDVVSKMQADGNKARRRNREAAYEQQQFTEIREDNSPCPF